MNCLEGEGEYKINPKSVVKWFLEEVTLWL